MSRPINKIFIKQIQKKEFDGKFQDNCLAMECASCVACIAAGICSIFCPPAAIGPLVVTCLTGVLGIGSAGAYYTKNVSEYLSNKEFNEQKVIDELKIEEDNL